MKPLSLPLNARRFLRGESHALLLDETARAHFLRLALVIRGSERHVFPALALDDWGREKKGLALFQWLYEEGSRFPRAELFGFDAHGAQTQIFLRDLELSFRLPCYVFDERGAPIPEGHRLQAIFIPGEMHHGQPHKIDPPSHLPWALRRAALRWRQIHPELLASSEWQPFPSPP